MIRTAKKDIKLYKAFCGNNNRAIAPIHHRVWGLLITGRILNADEFFEDDDICVPGVHASRLLHDAKLVSSNLIWVVIIPKGTRYYRSTIPEARSRFDSNATGSQYRSARVKLVREVKS